MKSITLFIATAMLQLHKGAFLMKIYSCIKLSVPLGISAWCLNKLTGWTISNQDYIASVLACIAIDHLIGSVYHAFKIRDFTFKKNLQGLLMKIGMCAASVILFEIISHSLKEVPLGYEYLKIITRLIVILYPAGSAFMNMSAITNGVFPPLGWIKKIKSFNHNLDMNKFTNDKKETE